MKQYCFGSVCSGIEAASVAWGPLGWRAAWLAEIEPFPCAVLAHHYPDVPNLGDMTKLAAMIRAGEIEAPDVFCGGTPCQAFSVAGLRRSLDDARGNLSLTFCEIADAVDTARSVRGDQPCIVFWENVPGVLNTKDNAFGCFLAGLAGEDEPLVAPGGKWSNAGAVLGPKRAVAWRVLDAQYFGVAQRRRRVFVVASARTGFDPAAVLFEFDGVRRDSAPRREAGEEVAPCVTAGAGNGGPAHGARSGSAKDNLIVPTAHTLRGEGFDASEDGTGRGTPLVPAAACPHAGKCHPGFCPCADRRAVSFHPTQDPIHSTEVCHAIGTGSAQGCATAAVAVGVTVHGTDPTVQKVASYDELAQCLRARTPGNIDNSSTTVVQQAMQVRRLTPTECERLQGFPDDYTAIPWRKKPASECPDGPRYKALGNSWAVPNVRWIGQRIDAHLRALDGAEIAPVERI